MRGGIDRSYSKGDNEDDVELWDKQDFDVEGKEVAEWETPKRARTTTKRARRRMRKKKMGGGEPPLTTMQKNNTRRRKTTYPHMQNLSRV